MAGFWASADRCATIRRMYAIRTGSAVQLGHKNLIGPYVVPAIDFHVFWCLTNKVPTSSTRGAGRPQGTFVIERILDFIANKLEWIARGSGAAT